MLRRYAYIYFIIAFLFSAIPFAAAASREAIELITPDEAAAPDIPQSALHLEAGREIGGPLIRVLKPHFGDKYSPPVQIRVRFIPREGHHIDLSSLKVEYLKFFTIDLTRRVRPYVTEDGIDIREAKLPSGRHTIRITIADKAGATTKQLFTIEVL